MLTTSTALKTSITGKQVLTLATCIKITLKDGTRIAFTTHTRNVIFIEEPDLIYYSKGFTPTAMSKNNEMAVDNAEAQMIIDSDLVKEDDLEKGKYNNAEYRFFQINWALKTNGYYTYEDIIKDMSGTLGNVKRVKRMFETEYRSLTQYLITTIVDLYKASCNATLGDSKCKKDLTAITHDDVIGAVVKNNTLIMTNTTLPDGLLNNGEIEFLTGQNAGRKYTIKTWVQSTKTLTLQVNVNYPVGDGDVVKLIEGCNKTKTRCIELSNYVNNQGFNDIPGLDFIMSGGGTKVNY